VLDWILAPKEPPVSRKNIGVGLILAPKEPPYVRYGQIDSYKQVTPMESVRGFYLFVFYKLDAPKGAKML
jgi:hypothetical protein